MKRLTLSISTILVFVSAALAQMTAFTYQGKLTDGGSPPTGQYDFVFRLYDQADIVLGTQIGSDVLSNDVQVTAGIFTVNLDFGASAFTSGADRYLHISVRPGASTGAYTPLAPLQTLTSSPFSIRSLSATSADSLSCVLCVTDGHIVSIDGSKVTGTVNNATNAALAENVSGVVQIANGGTGSATQNFVDITTNQRRIGGDKEFVGAVSVAGTNGIFNGNGAGLTNLNGANLTNGSVTAAKLAAGAVFRWNVVTALEIQAEANNGYVINRPNMEVDVNLPVDPQVGDVIRVESATEQGFRITQNGGQSITIGNGNLQNVAWTPRETERSWKSVASSADGTKLVAVHSYLDCCGSGSIPGFIVTSTDSGATWIDRTTGYLAAQHWSSVASSADGVKLVAAVNGGRIYTSTDSGLNWTPRESNRTWTSVISSADGTRLIALAPQVYISNDSGESWSLQTLQDARCQSVASSVDGGLMVGGCMLDPTTSNPRFGIVTSDMGGVHWVLRKSLLTLPSVASSADGTKLVAAVNGGQIYTSTDSGVTWTPREGNRQWVSVASSASGIRLVAAVKSGNIYTSTDSGITWTPQQGIRDWVSVASSADGTKLVAAADRDFIWTRGASVSTSGSLGGIIAGNSTSVELIYLGAGKFLILNQKGHIVLY